MGVRPSLDCCAVDAEKVLRAAGELASAGTRKEGSVIMDDEQMAALELLGTSMAGACGGFDFNSPSRSSRMNVAMSSTLENKIEDYVMVSGIA